MLTGKAGGLLYFCLVLCPVIDYHSFVQVRTKNQAEFFVRRVRKIFGSVGFAEKTHNETVSKALPEILDAHVRAPLEIIDFIDLALQSGKGAFDLSYLCRSRVILKLEKNHVAQNLGGLLLTCSITSMQNFRMHV